MIIGTAKEAEAVGQDLKCPLAEHQAVELYPLLENPEDQVLLLDAGVLGEVLFAGFLDQFGHRHPLQFGDVGVARLFDFLIGVAFFAAAVSAVFGGDFLGQGEGLFLLQGAQGVVERRRCRLLVAGGVVCRILHAGVGLSTGVSSLSGSIITLLLKGRLCRHAEGAGGGVVGG